MAHKTKRIKKMDEKEVIEDRESLFRLLLDRKKDVMEEYKNLERSKLDYGWFVKNSNKCMLVMAYLLQGLEFFIFAVFLGYVLCYFYFTQIDSAFTFNILAL
jgi:sugar-specific transcriptional regulator TrmB